MSYPAAKGITGVPPVLASGHPDRYKCLVGGTPATRHSRDGHVPLHEKAVAPLLTKLAATKLAATKRKTVNPHKPASTVGRALGRIKAHKYFDYAINAAGHLQ